MRLSPVSEARPEPKELEFLLPVLSALPPPDSEKRPDELRARRRGRSVLAPPARLRKLGEACSRLPAGGVDALAEPGPSSSCCCCWMLLANSELRALVPVNDDRSGGGRGIVMSVAMVLPRTLQGGQQDGLRVEGRTRCQRCSCVSARRMLYVSEGLHGALRNDKTADCPCQF